MYASWWPNVFQDEVHVCSSGPQARLGKRKKSYQNSSKKHAPLYRQFVKVSLLLVCVCMQYAVQCVINSVCVHVCVVISW